MTAADHPPLTGKPRMELRGWKPVRKGSLVGFAAVSLPNGLQIDDVAVLVTGGKAWASLPAKPVITADGRVAKLPGSSKTHYVAILRWRYRDFSTRFSQAVVSLIRERHPGDLDAGDAP